MRPRNERFAACVNWLRQEKYILDQKDLSQKTGITATTISRIMKGKVDPKEETLLKLNQAFGHMFNISYLRGYSAIMFADEIDLPESRFSEDSLRPYSSIPQWADSLISILAEQIKNGEALNQELRQSIKQVNDLRNDLQDLIEKK